MSSRNQLKISKWVKWLLLGGIAIWFYKVASLSSYIFLIAILLAYIYLRLKDLEQKTESWRNLPFTDIRDTILEPLRRRNDLGVLRGPNSSITHISVCPNWTSIADTFFKKKFREEWLPPERYYGELWRIDIFSDVLSGLTYQLVDGTHIRPGVSNWFGFGVHGVHPVLSSDEVYDLEGATEGWGRLVIGWRARKGLELISEVPEDRLLGTVNLRPMLEQLDLMDSIMVGASQANPIDPSQIDPKDTLKYKFETGMHMFENKFLTVYMRRQAFRGILTDVEDYTDERQAEFVSRYRGILERQRVANLLVSS